MADSVNQKSKVMENENSLKKKSRFALLGFGIILASFLIPMAGYAQPSSRAEFQKKIDQTLAEKFNITETPKEFNRCAYRLYLKNTDKNDDGFTAGYQTMQQCLPKYLNEIKFSDGGKKARELFLSDFKSLCVQENQQFAKQLNLNQFCQCILINIKKQKIGLVALITGEFMQTEPFVSAARKCAQESKN